MLQTKKEASLQDNLQDGVQPEGRLLKEQETCWRIARADRGAILIDTARYFAAVKAAMCRAQRSILLLGWNFDPRTQLDPDGRMPSSRPDRIGDLLNHLAEERPGLDIRVLIWDMALFMSARGGFFPARARSWFADGRVKFRLDGMVPKGACQHRKVVVIDDAVAFCGGGDFTVGRWDTTKHRDGEPHRHLPSGDRYPARHEVMMMVSGEAAASLGDLVRERWEKVTGETLSAPEPARIDDVWPEGWDWELDDIAMGIARTEAANGQRAIRESEELYVRAIAAARHCIYIENQYFASPVIIGALAKRLQEPNGPEIVAVVSKRSPGFLDGLCMDTARDLLVPRLREADRFGRFRICGPRTDAGRMIVVHSKLMIVDDWLLRIGSSNIANRSFGLDAECDLAFDASLAGDPAKARAAIAYARNRLLAHFLGRSVESVSRAIEQTGSLIAAIETLDCGRGRLPSLAPRKLGPIQSLIASYHCGDPESPADVWRPWRREYIGPQAGLSMSNSTTSGR